MVRGSSLSRDGVHIFYNSPVVVVCEMFCKLVTLRFENSGTDI